MARLLRFSAKIGIVGGTVYYTKSLGVWGDASDTERAYKNIYRIVAPYMSEIPVEVPEIPHLADVTSSLKNYWNSGVLATGKFILDLPQHSSSLAKEGYDYVVNQINPQGNS